MAACKCNRATERRSLRPCRAAPRRNECRDVERFAHVQAWLSHALMKKRRRMALESWRKFKGFCRVAATRCQEGR